MAGGEGSDSKATAEATEARKEAVKAKLPGETITAADMKKAADQGRAQNHAHLLTRHARLQGGGLLLADKIALHHLYLVGGDDRSHAVRSVV